MLLQSNNRILGIIAFVVFLLISTQSVFAISKKKNFAKIKPWAIQLMFEGDDANQDDFHGARFSVQRQLSNSHAVRFTIGVMDGIEDPFRNTVFYDDGISFVFNDRYSNTEEVELSLQYLFMPHYNRKINFYWGLGPRLSVVEAQHQPSVFFDSSYPEDWVAYTEVNSSTRIGLGFEGTFGAELFLGKKISLLAEYGFYVENRWYMFDVDYFSFRGSRDSDLIKFNEGSASDLSRFRLGIAMHF